MLVRLLKNLSDTHLTTLLDTFNSIFVSGDLAAPWKLATIILIRNPQEEGPSGYFIRPIALIPDL